MERLSAYARIYPIFLVDWLESKDLAVLETQSIPCLAIVEEPPT